MRFFVYILSMVIWTSNFALFARRRLEINTAQIGLLLGYIGLIVVLMRGFLLGKLIKLLGEKSLAKWGMSLFIVGLLLSLAVQKIWLLVLVMTLFAVGNGLSRPLLMGEISRAVSGREQGAILGVANSLGSLAQIIGPLTGGLILSFFWEGWLAVVSSLVMIFGLGLLLREEKLALAKKTKIVA